METDGYYYFNRCRRCFSLITKIEILEALRKDGVICTCGGGTFGPTNPLWYEWLTPKVLKMVAWQVLGRLAPAPEPSVMPPMPFPPNLPQVPALSAEEVRPPADGEC